MLLLRVKDNFVQFPIFMSRLLEVNERRRNGMAVCSLPALLFLTNIRDSLFTSMFQLMNDILNY